MTRVLGGSLRGGRFLMREVPLYGAPPSLLDHLAQRGGTVWPWWCFERTPRKTLGRGISKVNFQETLSIFGDQYPQNDSKNDPMAPRATLECPHEGPSVARCPLLSLQVLRPEWITQATRSELFASVLKSPFTFRVQDGKWRFRNREKQLTLYSLWLDPGPRHA